VRITLYAFSSKQHIADLLIPLQAGLIWLVHEGSLTMLLHLQDAEA
jgi:chorismate-pyruvate lyase